ncbi:MAG: flagellar export chaperone FlgN [Dethiobacteraceae bacterium]|jgi:flagellar biosynthesis/type III secretory pathway chaperone
MEQLVNVLKKQQQLLDQLLGLTKQEQEAIIARNTELLKISLKEKEQLTAELQRLEKERCALTGTQNCRSLAAAAGEQAELLEALRQSLHNQLQELKHLTTTNNLLLKTELACFQAVQEALGLQSTYTDKGTLTKNADRLPLVSRQA